MASRCVPPSRSPRPRSPRASPVTSGGSGRSDEVPACGLARHLLGPVRLDVDARPRRFSPPRNWNVVPDRPVGARHARARHRSARQGGWWLPAGRWGRATAIDSCALVQRVIGIVCQIIDWHPSCASATPSARQGRGRSPWAVEAGHRRPRFSTARNWKFVPDHPVGARHARPWPRSSRRGGRRSQQAAEAGRPPSRFSTTGNWNVVPDQLLDARHVRPRLPAARRAALAAAVEVRRRPRAGVHPVLAGSAPAPESAPRHAVRPAPAGPPHPPE